MRFNLHKILIVILSLSVVISLTGCSGFLKEMGLDGVEEYANEMIQEFVNNPYSIDQYSKNDVHFSSLTEEQQDIANEFASMYSDSIFVRNLQINDSRDKASLELVITGYKRIDDSILLIGDKNEIMDIISSIEPCDVSITLTLTRSRLEWLFDDLSQLEVLFIEPMQDLCILDYNGDPDIISSQYVSHAYLRNIVGGFWYDPLTGNPLDSNHIEATPFLQYVFYFNKPTSMDITVELRCDGVVIDSKDVQIDDSMVLDCNYGTDFDERGYGEGEYTVVLVAGGTDVIESEVLEVR